MGQETRQPTIMAVDNTPANLKLLEQMLRDSGYRVVAFPSGELALKAAAKSPPDLILLDINMPRMNGFEVCESLKADESLKGIPVIFISAFTETMDKVKAFNIGGVDYVTKPFQFEEVRARIETHLHLRRLQLELKKHNQHLQDLVREQVREISDSQIATIVALAKLAESRDDDTGQHIERTQVFCRLLASKLKENPGYTTGIDDKYIEILGNASPLHDIGKVGIPDSILLKPGKLTSEEFEIVKTHTTIGAETLQVAHHRYPGNAFIAMGIAIARSHHEKWDGSGYPDGLAAEDIPLAARIMALADVYDALRSERVYKPAFSRGKARAIITENGGKHFDPAMVEAFTTVEAQMAALHEQMSDGSAREKADLE